MKLRNKKTGEVATLTLSTNGEDLIIMGNDMLAHITKLSELKDYEDYKEPKDHYYIDYDGDIMIVEALDYEPEIKGMKQIGNYFDTREEAEKAVEKLKALKRLKDKGFRFVEWIYRYDQPKVKNHSYYNFIAICKDGEVYEDIDLLFGDGE